MRHLTRSGPHIGQHTFYRLVLRYLFLITVLLAVLVLKVVVEPSLMEVFG